MATHMYIKFESPAIGGEKVEVLSWSHGFAQPESPTRGGGGRATHQGLAFTKYLDAATSELLKMCWSGQQIGKATLRCFRDDDSGEPVEYLSVVMQHVVISNYSVSGGPGDVPVENVSLDYGTVM